MYWPSASLVASTTEDTCTAYAEVKLSPPSEYPSQTSALRRAKIGIGPEIHASTDSERVAALNNPERNEKVARAAGRPPHHPPDAIPHTPSPLLLHTNISAATDSEDAVQICAEGVCADAPPGRFPGLAGQLQPDDEEDCHDRRCQQSRGEERCADGMFWEGIRGKWEEYMLMGMV